MHQRANITGRLGLPPKNARGAARCSGAVMWIFHDTARSALKAGNENIVHTTKKPLRKHKLMPT